MVVAERPQLSAAGLGADRMRLRAGKPCAVIAVAPAWLDLSARLGAAAAAHRSLVKASSSTMAKPIHYRHHLQHLLTWPASGNKSTIGGHN